MVVVVVLDFYDYNNWLIIVMTCFTAVFQATQGTFTWVYVGQIACEEGLSIGTFVIWLGVLMLSIYTNKMFEVMGSIGTFGFFAGTCFAFWIFLTIVLKEIKGLSREECQVLYSSVKKDEQVDENGHLMWTKDGMNYSNDPSSRAPYSEVSSDQDMMF